MKRVFVVSLLFMLLLSVTVVALLSGCSNHTKNRYNSYEISVSKEEGENGKILKGTDPISIRIGEYTSLSVQGYEECIWSPVNIDNLELNTEGVLYGKKPSSRTFLETSILFKGVLYPISIVISIEGKEEIEDSSVTVNNAILNKFEDGFIGFQWGTPLEEVQKELERTYGRSRVITNDADITLMFDLDDASYIGQIECLRLSDIRFSFLKDKLFFIQCRISDDLSVSSTELLKNKLEQLYGTPEKTDKGSATWYVDKSQDKYVSYCSYDAYEGETADLRIGYDAAFLLQK